MRNVSKKNQASFAVGFDDIMSHGHPLSIFLLSHLAWEGVGLDHASFEDAFDHVRGLGYDRTQREIPALGRSARLAIMSIGKRIQFSSRNNENFQVTIDHRGQ